MSSLHTDEASRVLRQWCARPFRLSCYSFMLLLGACAQLPPDAPAVSGGQAGGVGAEAAVTDSASTSTDSLPPKVAVHIPRASTVEAPDTAPPSLSTAGKTPPRDDTARKFAAEKRAAEQRAAALWAADKRRAEIRAAKERAAALWTADKLRAETRVAEKRAAEKKAAEKRAAEKKAAEKKAAEKKAAEKKAAEKKAAEKKAAEKKAAESRAAENRAEAERQEVERLEAELAEAGRLEAELAAARAEAENAQARGADEPPAEAAKKAPPPPKRDWSEVEYPWEEMAAGASPVPAEKAGPSASDTADSSEEDTKRVAAAAPLRDWSQLKYPWEEGGAALPTAVPPETKTVAKQQVTAVKRARNKAKRRPLSVQVERTRIGNSRIEMVKLPGGKFQMGSSDGDFDERPVHEVTLRPFQLGRFEVTQKQWSSVMGSIPSYLNDCADCPVGNVSWEDTQLFIEKLNRQTGRKFRLPSEAEWEYACLAQGSDNYCGGSDETQVAWFAQNSGGRSQPVGQLEPNAFGLHDMSGNAYEWVADCWHGGYLEAPSDGRAWVSGDCQRRVLRGGAWYYAPGYAVATYRNANTPHSRFIIYGFRLAHDD